MAGAAAGYLCLCSTTPLQPDASGSCLIERCKDHQVGYFGLAFALLVVSFVSLVVVVLKPHTGNRVSKRICALSTAWALVKSIRYGVTAFQTVTLSDQLLLVFLDVLNTFSIAMILFQFLFVVTAWIHFYAELEGKALPPYFMRAVAGTGVLCSVITCAFVVWNFLDRSGFQAWITAIIVQAALAIIALSICIYRLVRATKTTSSSWLMVAVLSVMLVLLVVLLILLLLYAANPPRVDTFLDFDAAFRALEASLTALFLLYFGPSHAMLSGKSRNKSVNYSSGSTHTTHSGH
jgi:hypothetical protein